MNQCMDGVQGRIASEDEGEGLCQLLYGTMKSDFNLS